MTTKMADWLSQISWSFFEMTGYCCQIVAIQSFDLPEALIS